MNAIKLKSKGEFVSQLQEMLQKLGYSQVKVDGLFGKISEAAVMDFQAKNNLVVDGIVGPKTWLQIYNNAKPKNMHPQTQTDMEGAARSLNVEVAAIKAVNQVEAAGRRGFLANGKIMILFEGHVFWKELKKLGLNPREYVAGNETILYEHWTKKHYKGGLLEHDRLNQAMKINKTAALASASYGKFQIMGNNFKACGFYSVEDFVNAQISGEGAQLMAFVNFLKTNHLVNALRNKNWAAFAKGYNGPGFAKNKYDVKLAEAYNRFK